MAQNKKVDSGYLRSEFGAWQVPSEEHFNQLIDVAAISFKPGAGLTGGDPSPVKGVVDAVNTVALSVKAGRGMQVSASGIGLLMANNGGLELSQDNTLRVKTVSGGTVDGRDGLAVCAAPPLKVGSDVSIDIDETRGLQHSHSALGLHVDNQTLEVNNDNRPQVKYRECGGLKIDAQGALVLDLDIILGRVSIRVKQGKVSLYIPKNKDKEGPNKKVMFFINKTYCGEIYDSDGHIGYIMRKNETADEHYWIASLYEWVKTDDLIEVRFENTLLASHTVSANESAPANLPHITELKIKGTPTVGSSLTMEYTFQPGDKAAKDISYRRWEWYYSQTDSWWKDNDWVTKDAPFVIPSDKVNHQIRVLLTAISEDDNKIKVVGPTFCSKSFIIKEK